MDCKEFTRRLTEFMELHKQQLFRYACYRLGDPADAEDILQDIYLRMIDRYDPAKPIGNIGAYVYRSLFHACVSARHDVSRIPLDSPEVTELDAASPAAFEEEYARLTAIISNLPDNLAEVIRLKIFASMTFDDIASSLDVSSTTAKRRYYQALELLRSKYHSL